MDKLEHKLMDFFIKYGVFKEKQGVTGSFTKKDLAYADLTVDYYTTFSYKIAVDKKVQAPSLANSPIYLRSQEFVLKTYPVIKALDGM